MRTVAQGLPLQSSYPHSYMARDNVALSGRWISNNILSVGRYLLDILPAPHLTSPLSSILPHESLGQLEAIPSPRISAGLQYDMSVSHLLLRYTMSLLQDILSSNASWYGALVVHSFSYIIYQTKSLVGPQEVHR